MRERETVFSNFGRSVCSRATHLRPESTGEIPDIITQAAHRGLLARGHGLSYGDSAVNDGGLVAETSRLNHLLAFDAETGVLECEAGTLLRDLFLVDTAFIPPVLPGTLQATVGGAIAHDVHGKNNPHTASFGHHIAWIDLQTRSGLMRIHDKKDPELFAATIGGLGLTGIIVRAGLRLLQKPRTLSVHTEALDSLHTLLASMRTNSNTTDYQVAWINGFNPHELLYTRADYVDGVSAPKPRQLTLPPLPVRLTFAPILRAFNALYFRTAAHPATIMDIRHFNNPLDRLRHWNRLYGREGPWQCQWLIDENHAEQTIERVLAICADAGSIPALLVLKYFNKSGNGLLSFVKPGFSLAMDFAPSLSAKRAIHAIHSLITGFGGSVYLAKDLFWSKEDFDCMYPEASRFKELLEAYQSPMRSNLGRRLGLVP